MARKKFYLDNGIDFRNKITILILPCRKLIRKVNNSISNKEANEKGKKLTHPLKKKYDKWMTEYKKWAGKFTDRRGRRLIMRI